jgi:hypothetical protein
VRPDTKINEAGAQEQVAALLARDLAVHAPLDDPYDLARLLGSLREAGAHEQATALTGRLTIRRVSRRCLKSQTCSYDAPRP